MCVCLTGYDGDLLYDDDAETFSGLCERVMADAWVVHNNYINYVESGDINNDGSLLATEGIIPTGLNAWTYWNGRQDTTVTWQTKLIWPNSKEWAAWEVAAAKFNRPDPTSPKARVPAIEG